MRVVHLYDGHEQVYRGRGSVPGVVWNVAAETADRGHDVTVIERQWDGLPATATHDGVEFRRLSLRTGADEPWTRVPYELADSPVGLAGLVGDRTNFAVQSLRVLWGLDVDVVHVHLPFAANVLLTLAPWLRRHTVYTAHLGELRLNALDGDGQDGDTVEVPSVLRRVSPDVFLAKRAATTTVLNRSIRDQFLDRGVPASRVHVVPNGVDIDRFGDVDGKRLQTVSEEYGLAGGPTVLFVGTVIPRKGVTDLVEATARVADTHDDVRVVIAGETDLDGEYTERVQSLIRERGLDDVVDLAGFVPAADLPALYRLADVFALPSREEGFGMTAVEAMAAGTPVVATRVGGMPWLLGETDAGRLVEAGDVDGLATAITTILDSPDPRQMGQRAIQRARELSWSAVVERFLERYETVTRRAGETR